MRRKTRIWRCWTTWNSNDDRRGVPDGAPRRFYLRSEPRRQPNLRKARKQFYAGSLRHVDGGVCRLVYCEHVCKLNILGHSEGITMRSRIRRLGLTVFFVWLVLFVPPAAAFPSYATTVTLSGAVLTASNPYGKNGGVGSASDWDLYFDTSAAMPVLHMKNAQLNTLNGLHSLLWANGDLVVELNGTNELSYTGLTFSSVIGFACEGTVTFRDGSDAGTGQLIVSISNSYPIFEVFGVAAVGGIVVESGILSISVYHPMNATALFAEDSIEISGGHTALFAEGQSAGAIDCSVFKLSGGEVQTTVNGMGSGAYALRFGSAQFTGGNGLFSTVENGYGAVWITPGAGSFTHSGGYATFSGGDGAFYFVTAATVTPAVTGDILVSEFPSGLDSVRWNSSMDPLASRGGYASPYRFAAFLPAPGLTQTGDVSAPWVWAGVAGLTVLAAAGVYFFIRRKPK